MSRTDAHRPAWVQQFDPDVPASIHHDHTGGECIEETFEYARWQETAPRHHHYNYKCNKNEWVEEPCPHDDKKDSYALSPCWTIKNTFNSWLRWTDLRDRVYNPFKVREHTHGHRVRHDDWPCSCDDWPPTPTCDYHFDRRYWVYVCTVYGKGVPKWYLDHTWHNPERVRERDLLREAVKMANAGEDMDDFDFPNFQARHRSAYNYW